ncbi:hypothetical protein N7537_000594 [Penicillium hordei]|uniref:Uncharacterized protein n=1 Tax=Penicillium hordei TaxID=40994 RepID=A0AAD6H7J5_9EURO|nr:uncharacterized protein N7537_000594 [Penicillium hordei]KAJ5615480.1 hypothetical protein N7537_000594 [Penicillium hordei]
MDKIEDKIEGKNAFQTLQYHGSSSVNHRNSTEQTLGIWIGKFSLFKRGLVNFFFSLGISWNFSTNGCLDHLEPHSNLFFSSIISPISLPFSLSPSSTLSIKRARVESLYDPGSPCSFSPFADYLSSRVSRTITLSHHTATSFPAQRPLGNDLKALSLFILWSPLTSNAELQPSSIYQPPRPPAALTL